MKRLAAELIVQPGRKFRVADIDPDDTHGISREEAEPVFQKHLQDLLELQMVLYAESRRAVLMVLQGIDAAGKDGTIRHVMSGLNPQGSRSHPSRFPEGEEKRHDYLWRVHRAVPEWGEIGIFNRSHYEDVLVVRVHKLVPKEVWSRRYDQINDFERMLTENGVRILKFFLLISKDEQAKRFRERLTIRRRTGSFRGRTPKNASIGTTTCGLTRMPSASAARKTAPWYVIPAESQVVSQSGGGADRAGRDARNEAAVPEGAGEDSN